MSEDDEYDARQAAAIERYEHQRIMLRSCCDGFCGANDCVTCRGEDALRVIAEEEDEAERVAILQQVSCIGRSGNNGCGYEGGPSGGTCPKCGGMLLSGHDIRKADSATAEWEKRNSGRRA